MTGNEIKCNRSKVKKRKCTSARSVDRCDVSRQSKKRVAVIATTTDTTIPIELQCTNHSEENEEELRKIGNV